MSGIKKLLTAIALLGFALVSISAKAQYETNPTEGNWAAYSETVDELFIVNTGTIYNVRAKQYVTPEQVQLMMPAVVVGVIVGAAGGGGAAYATNGSDAKSIVIGAFFGGLTSAYGAVAAATTGAVRAMYGTLSVGSAMSGAKVVSQMGPPAAIGPTNQCPMVTCLIVLPPEGAEW